MSLDGGGQARLAATIGFAWALKSGWTSTQGAPISAAIPLARRTSTSFRPSTSSPRKYGIPMHTKSGMRSAPAILPRPSAGTHAQILTESAPPVSQEKSHYKNSSPQRTRRTQSRNWRRLGIEDQPPDPFPELHHIEVEQEA
jgi:hypothetical protein